MKADLRQRNRELSGIAELNGAALEGKPLDVVFDRACSLIGECLSPRAVRIVKTEQDRDIPIAGSAPAGVPVTRSLNKLAIPITRDTDGQWGHLEIFMAREATSEELRFAATVASTVSHAIHRRATEVELRWRARQQSAIAELTRLAFSQPSACVIEYARKLLRTALEADLASFVSVAPETMGRSRRSDAHARAALQEGEPILVRSYGDDVRFAELSGEEVSGIAAAARGQRATYGAFVVASFQPRRFSAEDGRFAGAVASLTARALDAATDAAIIAASEASRKHLLTSIQSILQSTVQGICAVDVHGTCTLVNPAGAAMLGAPAAELTGRKIHDFVGSAECDRTGLDLALSGVPVVSRRCRFRREGGASTEVEYSAAPIVDDGTITGAVITFADISERRRLEAQLDQARRLEGLGRLAATVAHEFNNVLMAISPFAEMIRREATPRARSAADQIGRAVDRGKRVTSEILRFTQSTEIVRTELQLAPWMTALAGEAGRILGERNSLILEIGEKLPPISADGAQLHQAFTNMILNARDASEEGGRIWFTAEMKPPEATYSFGVLPSPGAYVHLYVRDEGSGIDAETLEHIFEPLYTTKRGGTGLGLAVTRQIVDRHDGFLFVESAPGSGTAFHVFLPVAESATPEPEPPPERDVPRERRDVLLVEDDPAVAEGTRMLLELEGMSVRLAGTGEEAIAAAKERRPDVLVLDVGLPDVTGDVLYGQLSRIHGGLPVVFSTGHQMRSAVPSEEAAHVEYLLKPYSIDELLTAIAAVHPKGTPRSC